MKKHKIEVEEDQRFLEELHTNPQDEIGLGALVKLDDLWLYISIASQPFEFDGITIHPMSTKAPLFKELQDKSKGDQVVLSGKKKIILAVF